MQDAPATGTALREHSGEGRVTAIGDGTVTLSHGPIPTIEWGAMTMEFTLPAERRADLHVGEQVRFAFTVGNDGKPRLTRIEPSEGLR